ncbi:L,D-transpeptidase family protein [Desulfuromonas sp. DDH964]|uniref:L,D-transpeptidase family protein n=1 Tax=Desulfuromonas sp. DDH964 TaxID=1823759 RepID=UPI0018D38168|nr:L,D-transpeptidase family protein [Desulfuromonas sp. DDH964]
MAIALIGRGCVGFWLMVLCAGPGWGGDQPPIVNLETMAVQQQLTAAGGPNDLVAATPWHPQLQDFYQRRGYQPAWLAAGQPGRMIDELREVLNNAAADGLCPEDYHLDQIESLLALPAPPAGLEAMTRSIHARLDLLLSDAFLLYATDLVEGRVDPNLAFDDWHVRSRRVNPSRLLEFALQQGRVKSVLTELLPPQPAYFDLRRVLADYRSQWLAGDWPVVPGGPTLRPGMEDPRLPLLRQRLQAGGDLAVGAGSDAFYDPEMVAAVKRFQSRHGLGADGVLGERTRAELNVPLTTRIRQLELNLERWRWLPHSLGTNHILVNIADFRLTVVEDDLPVLSMPVVVGTAYRKTPVFSGRLSYLELSPYWYVPPTILREDLLPKVKGNPGLLTARHFEIVGWDGVTIIDPATIDWRQVKAENFPGMLRQRPGPWNPLGRVKFMFPNPYAVYLHDTADPGLFGREIRSFSSGCIRIQRPFALVSYLLRGDPAGAGLNLSPGALPAVPLRVDLANPLPVHILYWTAWVDGEGRINFRDDIYRRDFDLNLALESARRATGALLVATPEAGVGRGG